MKKTLFSALLSLAALTPTAAQDVNYQNPASWGGQCQTGQSQSPIDINGTEAAMTHRLMTAYSVTPLSMADSSRGLMQGYAAGSYMQVGDKKFELKGLVFRTPSEHSVMGKSFPAAIQFVHENSAGHKAIIAVMVAEGAENLAAKEWLDRLPKKNGRSQDMKTLLNARDLMPFDTGYYRYMGSLTTPPCSEGVNWYVMKTPITMSKAQISSLSALTKGKTRPIQRRNFRLIIDTESQ